VFQFWEKPQSVPAITLTADQAGEVLDAPRDQFRMLDHVGRVGDQPRNEDLSVRELHAFPDLPLVLMPRVPGFEHIGLRTDPQDQIDDIAQRHI
jgi:hypothetical protein